MREAIAFLLLACACGAALSERPRATGSPGADPAPDVPGESPHDETEGTADGGRAFAALEALAAALAPGMRRAAERESAGERVLLVRAADRDACIRVAFEASDAITAKLVSADGTVLAQTTTASLDGALGERGPVCIRKGDSVSAASEGGATRIRWIAWASP